MNRFGRMVVTMWVVFLAGALLALAGCGNDHASQPNIGSRSGVSDSTHAGSGIVFLSEHDLQMSRGLGVTVPAPAWRPEPSTEPSTIGMVWDAIAALACHGAPMAIPEGSDHQPCAIVCGAAVDAIMTCDPFKTSGVGVYWTIPTSGSGSGSASPASDRVFFTPPLTNGRPHIKDCIVGEMMLDVADHHLWACDATHEWFVVQ